MTLGVVVAGFVVFDLTVTNESERASQRRLDGEIRRALPSTLARALDHDLAIGRGRPVPGPSTAPARPGAWLGVISIPSISLRQVVVEGTGRDQLALGPGHYSETAALGAAGNSAIAGHRTTFGGPFLHLDELRRGDAIVVTTFAGAYRYVVSSVEVVAPSDVAVLDRTSTPTLTLTTCTPAFTATSRLVVVAHLASSRSFQPPGASRVVAVPVTATVIPGSGGWWGVIGYGTALATIAASASWALARSRRRAGVLVAAVAVSLPVLLLFYGALALELPGSL